MVTPEDGKAGGKGRCVEGRQLLPFGEGGPLGRRKGFALMSIRSTGSGTVLSQGRRDRPLSQVMAAVLLQKSSDEKY